MKFAIIILLAVVLLMPASAVAQKPEEVILLDFTPGEDELPIDITLSPGWEVSQTELSDGSTGDALIGTGGADSEILFVSQDEPLTNHAVEVVVRFASGGSFFVTMSMGLDNPDCLTGYTLDMFSSPLEPLLLATDSDCIDQEIDTTTDAFPFDEWVIMRVEVIGDSMMVLFDGEIYLSGNVSTVPGDIFSVLIFDDTRVEVESLKLIELDAGELASGPGSSAGSASAAVILTDHAGAHEDAIAELEALDLIPAGGRLLFREDYAFFTGFGSYFTPMAHNSPHTNIVMAGELTFNSGAPDDTEICSLTARITTDNSGRTTSNLDIALVNSGTMALIDNSGSGDPDFFIAEAFYDPAVPHHVLLIALGDELMLFVDGEQVISDAEVDPRAGTYGITMRSSSGNSRCEGRNIWVYHFD
jgi:hypothetical protein